MERDRRLSTPVELRLRQSGIPVVDKFSGNAQKPGVLLNVDINTLAVNEGASYVYSLHLYTLEMVTLPRVIPVRAVTQTWTNGNFGIVGKNKLVSVRDTINDLADKFANDYLAQNPVSHP